MNARHREMIYQLLRWILDRGYEAYPVLDILDKCSQERCILSWDKISDKWLLNNLQVIEHFDFPKINIDLLTHLHNCAATK
jgi:hypothetical protein